MLVELFKELHERFPVSGDVMHHLFYDRKTKIPKVGVWTGEEYLNHNLHNDNHPEKITALIKLFEALNNIWPTFSHHGHVILYDPVDNILLLCIEIDASDTRVLAIDDYHFEDIDKCVMEIEAYITKSEYSKSGETSD